MKHLKFRQNSRNYLILVGYYLNKQERSERPEGDSGDSRRQRRNTRRRGGGPRSGNRSNDEWVVENRKSQSSHQSA